jgi:hypothetical protein
MRQFNSWNGPVKTKFAYLCTNGCCSLRNTLLVKLCTLWDDGATVGNSLKNCFPEYLAVAFSRCDWCQKGQKIFSLSGHFFNFGNSQICRWLIQVNKVDGPFFVMEFLARNLQTLNSSCARALLWWRIHLWGQSLFLRTDYRNLFTISKKHCRFTVYPHAMNS